ncbi:MAG: hypothetical protein C4340_03180 [Armatimonadota bacterium]
MNCEKAFELFSDYFEGRLSQGLREAVERHLAACPFCQVEYEQFASVVGSIAYPAPPNPPHDLGERIARRLDRIDFERRSRRPLGLRFLLPAAAAGVVILCIVLFSRSSEPPQVVSSGALTAPDLVLQEPFLGTRVLEGGRLLSLFGTEGSSYTILEGGTDFSTFPPPDAVEVETGKFKVTGTISRPIEVKSPDGAFIWVRFDIHEDILLLVVPSATPRPIRATPNAVTALKAFADRHHVTVLVRLNPAGGRTVPSVPMTDNLIADIAAFAAAAEFDHSSSLGPVVRFH